MESDSSPGGSRLAGYVVCVVLAALAGMFVLAFSTPLTLLLGMLTWWQPSSTLMFGVAEEAWARVLLVGVLFLLFRRVARAHTALLTAALVATYWFAFVHMPGNPVGTLIMGTVFVLPMTYLYLRRGLEAAIGFHICANLVKFTAAYLITADLWFR